MVMIQIHVARQKFIYHVLFSESMIAMVDCFRVALENCGNSHVIFTNGGQMKRKKSRTHALDISTSGMQHNLSESQLVQVGSRAVSNVAEQFSKLGHSLHPKILTGKKATAMSYTNTVPASEESAKKYAAAVVYEDNTCGNEEVRFQDSVGLSESSNEYNDNSFLQSVGIVMVDETEMAETRNQSRIRNPSNNNLENVARISISSVTDNVKLPLEMLDIHDLLDKSNATPEIKVQDTEDSNSDKNNGLKVCHSVADMRSDSNCIDDGARYVVILSINTSFFI